VHHFARQLASPFPRLAAVSARTSRIEIGTAVIDMRYEKPLYMAEDTGAADIIAGGRLQLGISSGSPEQVIAGWRYFGYARWEGETDADMGRRHAGVFYALLQGKVFGEPNRRPMFRNAPGLLVSEKDRAYFGHGGADDEDQIGFIAESETVDLRSELCCGTTRAVWPRASALIGVRVTNLRSTSAERLCRYRVATDSPGGMPVRPIYACCDTAPIRPP